MARSKRSEPEVVDVLAAEEFGVPAPDPALSAVVSTAPFAVAWLLRRARRRKSEV
jgi:hypothetical protein